LRIKLCATSPLSDSLRVLAVKYKIIKDKNNCPSNFLYLRTNNIVNAKIIKLEKASYSCVGCTEWGNPNFYIRILDSDFG